MSLEVNKVVAAVLTAGIAFMVTGVVGDAIVHPRKLETVALAVPTQQAAAPAAAPAEEIPPVAPLLANASADTGRQLVQRNCSACHNFVEGGPNGVGPNLYGIVGNHHAHAANFNYSTAMAALVDKTWDYEALNQFITKPSAAIQGTKMGFAGLRNPQQRADVLAYLRTLAAEPVPLP